MSVTILPIEIRFDREITDGQQSLFVEVLRKELLEGGSPSDSAWGIGFARVADIVEQTCTCDDAHACEYCQGEASKLIGKTIRDSHEREWVVEEVGEKDGMWTLEGGSCWTYFEPGGGGYEVRDG